MSLRGNHLFLVSWLLFAADVSIGLAGALPTLLDIRVDDAGVAHVRGMVMLHGRSSLVHAVLTDYPNWPSLFGYTLRVNAIRYEKGRVITELFLRGHLGFGEWRLLTESREIEPNKLEMRLIEGDFTQYTRIWQLFPSEDMQLTRAELYMDIQPKAWMPGWLFARILRDQLEDHFEKVNQSVAAREHG
jgi:hypothetical protein